MPHFPPRAAGDGGLGQVHFTPLKSAATGLGAGFTRAASRTLTFPLDTVKTRSQLSRLGAEDRARLPVVRRLAHLAPRGSFFPARFLDSGEGGSMPNMLPFGNVWPTTF